MIRPLRTESPCLTYLSHEFLRESFGPPGVGCRRTPGTAPSIERMASGPGRCATGCGLQGRLATAWRRIGAFVRLRASWRLCGRGDHPQPLGPLVSEAEKLEYRLVDLTQRGAGEVTNRPAHAAAPHRRQLIDRRPGRDLKPGCRVRRQRNPHHRRIDRDPGDETDRYRCRDEKRALNNDSRPRFAGNFPPRSATRTISPRRRTAGSALVEVIDKIVEESEFILRGRLRDQARLSCSPGHEVRVGGIAEPYLERTLPFSPQLLAAPAAPFNQGCRRLGPCDTCNAVALSLQPARCGGEEAFDLAAASLPCSRSNRSPCRASAGRPTRGCQSSTSAALVIF